MSDMKDVNTPISRRHALILGGGVAGGLMAAASPLLGATPRAVAASVHDEGGGDNGGFSQATITQMEAILQTTGTQQNGVLSFELDRDDLQGYTIGGNTIPTPVPYSPAWENNGTFYFQKLGGDRRNSRDTDNSGGNGRAILNGDFGGLLPQEIDPFIDALLTNGLIFQAYHQHFTDIHPNELYYIHFRGVGNPLTLAQGVIAAVKTTGTPLPQSMPPNPTTPLPTDQLAQILGGPATVGADGVVTVDVPRRDRVILGGVPISPFLNIDTAIAFEPLDSGGTMAAVAPDFSLVASEIQSVIGVMRQQGWVIGCLYNQETEERPQPYFSHQLKVGDPVALAQEVRRGLDQTNSARP